ncbi:MAG: hypothetical protein KHY83_11570, partial [Coriobacteriia bacterium]|nr:hypothetical protein [Coriobacteriia bacterium]
MSGRDGSWACGWRRSPGEIAARAAGRRAEGAAAERGLTRRSFMRGAATCAAGLAGAAALGGLTGCSTGGGPDELNVYWWAEYVPEALVEGFEEEFGIKVNQTFFSSNED